MRPNMRTAFILAGAILAAVVGLELVAATTNLWPTWSEMIWHLDDRVSWFRWVVVVVVVVLLGHFFLRWWGPPRRRI